MIQIVPPAMTNKMRPDEQDELEVIHFLSWRIDVEEEAKMNHDLESRQRRRWRAIGKSRTADQ